jgi:hypothetical protein
MCAAFIRIARRRPGDNPVIWRLARAGPQMNSVVISAQADIRLAADIWPKNKGRAQTLPLKKSCEING